VPRADTSSTNANPSVPTGLDSNANPNPYSKRYKKRPFDIAGEGQETEAVFDGEHVHYYPGIYQRFAHGLTSYKYHFSPPINTLASLVQAVDDIATNYLVDIYGDADVAVTVHLNINYTINFYKSFERWVSVGNKDTRLKLSQWWTGGRDELIRLLEYQFTIWDMEGYGDDPETTEMRTIDGISFGIFKMGLSSTEAQQATETVIHQAGSNVNRIEPMEEEEEEPLLRRGSCNNFDKNGRIGMYFVRGYKSKNNECLTNLFCKVTGRRNNGGFESKNVRAYAERLCAGRLEKDSRGRDIPFPRKGEGVPVAYIKYWTSYFNLGCKVYDPDGNLIYVSEDNITEDASTINILIANNHYHHIYNEKMKKFKQCPRCYKVYRRTHNYCDPKRVQFIQGYYDHTKRSRKIYGADIYTRTPPDRRCMVFYDKETLPIAGEKVHTPYNICTGRWLDNGETENAEFKYYWGQDSLKEFVEAVLDYDFAETIYMCSFNGSAYDDYFVLRHMLLHCNVKPKYKYHNGKVIRMSFTNRKEKEIIFWDLR
jgi:hypothetical protein